MRESGIVTVSPRLREVLAHAERLACIPRPVLIRGERGTGKELLAALVHAHSDRSEGSFVAVNCAVYSDALLASEIFGHERGAFTGAERSRAGCLERAQGGVLFLDEIGNMSLKFQERLLRVIETRTFERLGGIATLEADVRLISATNADLEELMAAGEFRQDFYDRIAFETLTLPPLRERREDVPVLIDFFTQALAREIPNLEPRRFTAEATALMADYYWPGNVRELKNAVERLLLRDGPHEIGTSELPREVTASSPVGDTFEEKVEAYKQHLVLGAWRDAHYSQKRAADRLGMTYDQFRHYFRKYRLADLAAPPE